MSIVIADVCRPVPITQRLKIDKFIEYYKGSSGQPAPFGGRRVELEKLREWLDDPQAPRHLLITAPAGRGKTALVVNWLGQIPNAWNVAFFPISIRFQTNQSAVFYEAMAHQLANIAKETAGATQRDTAVFYKERCLELLHAIREKQIQTVIIVDGLDEIDGWNVDPSLLQTSQSGLVRIVVSARTLAGDREGASDWLQRLDWHEGLRLTQCIFVPPLGRLGIGEALDSMSVSVADLAGPTDMLGELQRLTQGDPLLVRMYADSLWKRDEASQNLTAEELQQLDPGYVGFFKVWFEKQSGSWMDQNSPYRKQLEAVIAVLSVTLGPLEQRYIEMVCGDMLDGHIFSLSAKDIEPIKRFLIGDGLDLGFSFQHPKFAQYFEQEYFRRGAVITRARSSIVSWLKAIVHGLLGSGSNYKTVPRYVLEHCLQHLTEEDLDLETLEALLSGGWQKAWYHHEGGYLRYITDITDLMSKIALLPSLDFGRRWVLRIQCGLILSSVFSIGSITDTDLLIALVRQGNLSTRQALHRLFYKTPKELATGLSKLFIIADQASRITILAAVDAIQDAAAKARALGLLAEQMPEALRTGMLDQALTAAHAIEKDTDRDEVLGSLIGRLPGSLLDRALIAADAISDDRIAAKAFGLIAERLSEPRRTKMLDRALAAAAAIEYSGPRAEAFASLAEQLPEASRTIVLNRALKAAEAIEDDYYRPKLLESISKHFPKALRTQVLDQALTAAEMHDNDYMKGSCISSLAAHLPEAFLHRALTAAETITYAKPKADALGSLAEHLPEPDRIVVLDRALAVADAIPDHQEDKALALALLAERLPEPRRTEVHDRALKAAEALKHGHRKLEVLCSLAEHLPEALVDRALISVGGFANGPTKARALAALAERLPTARRTKVLDRALMAAEAINDDTAKIRAIASLVGCLPEELGTDVLRRALVSVESIERDDVKYWALELLAKRLPEGLLNQSLEIAEAIQNNSDKARALMSLAERFPGRLLETGLSAAEAIGNDMFRANLLTLVAGRLPVALRAEVLDRALTAAGAIRDARDKASALGRLAKHLPVSRQPEVLDRALTAAAEAIGNGSISKGSAFNSLVEHLPDEMLDRVLIAVEAIGEDSDKAIALSALVGRLPEALLDRALTAIETMENQQWKNHALKSIAERLPEAMLDRALTVVATQGADLTDLLVSLAKRLPEARRTDVLDQALTAAEAVEKEDTKGRMLCLLAEHLPDKLLRRALIAAGQIGDGRERALALESLARLLPGARRTEVFDRALVAAGAIESDFLRAWTLLFLAKHPPPARLTAVLDQAVAAAAAMQNHATRAKMFRALAKTLPEARQTETLDQALTAAERVMPQYEKADIILAVVSDYRDQRNYSILDRIPCLLATLERERALKLLEETSLHSVLDHYTVSLLAHAILDICLRWP